MSLQAERGLIGAILINQDVIHDVYATLKPDMLVNPFDQDCYTSMLAMYDRGEKINMVSLCQQLENKEHDRADINEVLKTCFELAPTSVMAKSYADEIIKDYKTEKVKEYLYHTDIKASNIDDTIANFIARLDELQNNQEVKSKSLKEIIGENKDKYFKPKTVELVRTGLARLDDCLGGLESGDITVIGARPAVGKSALVTQILTSVAKKGKKVGYFNLEMSESQVYERMISKQSNIALSRVRRATNFLGEEELIFQDANAELEKLNIIISTNTRRISEIRNESRHQEYDLIVIDYLQLIQPDRKYPNRASEVGDISKAVKSLAMELKIPIILLSQLNRVSEQNQTREPNMAELRESGDIEQDASNIILLWNVSDKNHRYKGLKVEKNRQGALLREGLEFDGEHMKFVENNAEFDSYLNFVKAQEKEFESVADNDTPWG